MAYGDIGGSRPELIITMRAALAKDEAGAIIPIRRGDAVTLCDPACVSHDSALDPTVGYWVTNTPRGVDAGSPVVGMAISDCKEQAAHVPIIVRGLAHLRIGKMHGPGTPGGYLVTMDPDAPGAVEMFKLDGAPRVLFQTRERNGSTVAEILI